MTREEEIEKAAKECYYKCPYYLYNENEETIVDVFTEGAQWADKHPNTKDIWHDVSEEPVKDTHILIESSFFEDDLDYYSCHWSTSICPSWEEYVKEYNIKRWAYLGDLVDI